MKILPPLKHHLNNPPQVDAPYVEFSEELGVDVLINAQEKVNRVLNYITLENNVGERNQHTSKSVKIIFEDDVENGNKGWKSEILNHEGELSSKDNNISWQLVHNSPFEGNSWQLVYANNAINDEGLVNVLKSPLIDLRNHQGSHISLSFDHVYNFASQYWGALEGGIVQISKDQGLTWTTLVPERGYPGVTSSCSNYLFGQTAYTHQKSEKAFFNLNAFAGKIIQIRFLVDINGCYHYYSNTDPSNTSWVPAGNWKIDNILITVDRRDQDGDGITDDIDEFPDDPDLAFTQTYPASGYQVSAFEDLWPSLGDYDMNDVVIRSKITYYLDALQVYIKAEGELYIHALGSAFENGLALQILDFDKRPLPLEFVYEVAGDAQKNPAVFNGIIISENLFESIPSFYKNNGVGPSATPHKMTFSIQSYRCARIRGELLTNFYIFRSDDHSHEIHLPGYPATNQVNTALFSTGDDATRPSLNQWYISRENLPWGIEIISESPDYQHPLERTDIREAYPNFPDWVASNGQQQPDWFLFPDVNKVFHFE